jgi:hypothetical protein
MVLYCSLSDNMLSANGVNTLTKGISENRRTEIKYLKYVLNLQNA